MQTGYSVRADICVLLVGKRSHEMRVEVTG